MGNFSTSEVNSDQHLDVIIVGAGISGIGAAHHLKDQCSEKTFLILDSKESLGGTWLQHTYPGIRSDSDLYTFGYRFKPWTGKPVAQGDDILEYMDEVVRESNLEKNLRYRHSVVSASWSSEQQLWTISGKNTETSERFLYTCNFLWMCQGYYRHEQGYTPQWKDMGEFQGRIVHPQSWPADLDYKDKNVVVIGSGATAATLIPNMAEECRHITMLQRSPTYFWTGENRNELADQLRGLEIPEEWVHEIVRRNILKEAKETQYLSNSHPELIKEQLLKVVQDRVGEKVDMSHFTPSYRPWQQRVAYVPDGDLFESISSGKVSVVTDHIDCLTKDGIMTQSGEMLKADIIVTATGFNICVMGDIAFDVDGSPIDYSKTYTYRGLMNSSVPNMCYMFGYLRTSWTMRVDLISDFVCRLLKHMDSKGASSVTPALRECDENMPMRPWMEEDQFNPGYMKRSLHLMPKQGDKEPWIYDPDYYVEKDALPMIDLDEQALLYSHLPS